MSSKGRRRRRSTRRPDVLQRKPRGVISPRVQAVGPEHFGIVCVDCAKARSKWMLADYYGKVLIPPTVVAHTGTELEAVVQRICEAQAEYALQDMVVSIERTGRYHHPIRRAFLSAGYDARIIHPFTVRQFRLPADPGTKTDDTDLAANHRATVAGFALSEALNEPVWQQLQLLIRHRRDQVRKASTLCCQIKEHLQEAMPGYAALFSDFWKNKIAMKLALHFGSSQAIVQAGLAGLALAMHQQGLRFQQRTLQGILGWAAHAAPGDPGAPWHIRIATALEEDRASKGQLIQCLERQIAQCLATTPYVLLLSIPGINVVCAGDFAGEAGPIRNYPTARGITGRAGLYPSRYQSDAVDRPDGAIVKCSNRSLRFAILQAADCLVNSNHHFGSLAKGWRDQGADPRMVRVRVGCRFARIAFQLVAGRKVFRHPAMRDRSYILDKLLRFHMEHGTPGDQVQADLQAARRWLAPADQRDEAVPLQQQLDKRKRGRSAQPLGQILSVVLAELRAGTVQSEPSGI
jgi:transposase